MGDYQSRRSQLDQLYSDGSSSRLDPNPGLDEATTDATRRRVAVGRADRVIAKALRSNDPKTRAWGAEQTLERSKTAGWEGPPAGITQHGQFDQKDRSSGQERIERGLQMKDEATRPGGPKNVGDQPTRDGLAPPAPSAPSPEPSATGGATTSPARQEAAGNTTPDRNKAVQDVIRKNKIEKFGKDLMGMGSSGKSITSEKLDSVFEYGDSLGITREQTSAQIKKGSDTPREKDNSLKIDPKYAVSDEQASAMDKAGINGKPEKKLPQADIELEKIKKEFNAGLSPEQQKASEERKSDAIARNNQDRIGLDALKTPDDFPSKGKDLSADEIRARGKERMDEYDRLEKERLDKRDPAIARLEGERGSLITDPEPGKVGAPGSDRELGALAADEVIKARKEITNNLADLHSDTQTSIFGNTPSSAFSGRAYQSDWVNDESQGIMPSKEFLRENADNPEAIKNQIRTNIRNRQNIDEAFNSDLGGKSKTAGVYVESNPLIDLGEGFNSKTKEVVAKNYTTDAFNQTKNKALGLKANLNTGTMERSGSTRAKGGMDEFLGVNNEEEKRVASNKLIESAVKNKYPIWEDKELMDDPGFKARAMKNPVLKEKIQAHEKQSEERNTQQASYNNSQRMKKEFQGHSDLITKLLT